MKVAFDIYTDTEFLLEPIDTCNKNPEKSATAKIDKHTTWVIHDLYIVQLIVLKNTRLSFKRFKRTRNKVS